MLVKLTRIQVPSTGDEVLRTGVLVNLETVYVCSPTRFKWRGRDGELMENATTYISYGTDGIHVSESPEEILALQAQFFVGKETNE